MPDTQPEYVELYRGPLDGLMVHSSEIKDGKIKCGIRIRKYSIGVSNISFWEATKRSGNATIAVYEQCEDGRFIHSYTQGV